MNYPEPNVPIIEEIELTPLDSVGELVVLDKTIQVVPTKPLYLRYWMPIVTILMPMAVVIVYLFFIASNRYVSEAEFMVQSAQSDDSVGDLGSMVQSSGLSRANDETYAVNEFIQSRDIVALLVRNNHLRDILSRPEADFINRFPNFYSPNDEEALYRRYLQMVSANIDSDTGLSTISVQAFRPGDAQALTIAILGYAEDLINNLNARAYDDALRFSQGLVDQAQSNAAEVEAELTQFRNQSGSVDPEKEAAADFEVVGKMTTNLVQLEATLQQQIAVAPESPAVDSMREKVTALSSAIDKLKLDIAGNGSSLASKLADYEKLTLQRNFAGQNLAQAVAGLVKAKEDAQEQHLYIQRIVEPDLADEAQYPMRLLWTLVAFAICLTTYSILRTIRSTVMEHRA